MAFQRRFLTISLPQSGPPQLPLKRLSGDYSEGGVSTGSTLAGSTTPRPGEGAERVAILSGIAITSEAASLGSKDGLAKATSYRQFTAHTFFWSLPATSASNLIARRIVTP
jgi:hypothetical protein